MLLTPVSIQGVSVDIVDDCKYLVGHTDKQLDWIKYTNAPNRKGKCSLLSETAEVIVNHVRAATHVREHDSVTARM